MKSDKRFIDQLLISQHLPPNQIKKRQHRSVQNENQNASATYAPPTREFDDLIGK